jgi:hypothetical protein
MTRSWNNLHQVRAQLIYIYTKLERHRISYAYNTYNAVTFLCLSQARTYMLWSFFCVHWVIVRFVDWWNYWLSHSLSMFFFKCLYPPSLFCVNCNQLINQFCLTCTYVVADLHLYNITFAEAISVPFLSLTFNWIVSEKGKRLCAIDCKLKTNQ